MPVEHMLKTLNKHNAAPSLLGFGISKPEQVKEAIQSGAAGAISGSAVVKIIQDNLDNPERLLQKMHSFISKMKLATHK